MVDKWREHDQRECKEGFDGSQRAKARLAREMVALANSGGGALVYGISDGGQPVGLDPRSVKRLDPANIGNYLVAFLGSQRVVFEVVRQDINGNAVVEIRVSAHTRPPLVMEKDGTYGEEKSQQALFRAGDVLTRSATKATLAGVGDIDRWISAAERRGEQRAYELMRRIAERPAGFEVVLRPPDTPTARLNAAAQAFADDPAKLLDGDDLLRAATDLEAADLAEGHELVAELLVQSAFRKRATLWWWLVELDPDPPWLVRQLGTVPPARDRDVSDSGKAVLEVAAMLCPDAFAELQRALGESTYSHFQKAAALYPDVATTEAAVLRRIARVKDRPTRSEVQQAFSTARRSASRRGPLAVAAKLSLVRWAGAAGYLAPRPPV